MPNPFDQFDGPQAVTVPLGPRDPNKAASDAIELQLKRAQLAKAMKDASKEQVGDEQIEALAKLYAANKLVPPSRPNEVAQKAIARAMEIDPDFDPELAGNRAKAIKDFSGNGQASQAVRSVNRLANHLNDMYEASEKMGGPNLGWSPLNRIVAGVEQSAEPELTAKYDAALPGVANEIDKILRGTGSPTVSGVAESMATLKRARSLDERRAAFKQIAGLIHGALDPIKQSWNSAYGGSKAPPMWVSPKAAAVFGKIDPDNAGTFGGDDWRGLPGLKGDGSPGQGTPPDNGSGAPPPAGGGGPSGPSDQIEPATGDTRTEISRGPAEQKLAAMFAGGTPSANIRAYAKANDFPVGKVESALAWRAMNPAYKGSYDVSTERVIPTTFVQRAAAHPIAAGFLAAADAADAGLTDEAVGAVNTLRNGGSLSDNIAAADYSKQLNLGANSNAALVGGVIGGTGAIIGGGMGLNALLRGGTKAGLGRNALAWAARNPVKAGALGDAGYGVVYGAGENNDNRALGAAVGAPLAAAGSVVGSGLTRGAGAVLQGVADPAIQRLRAAGIPLTAGEVLGGGWKKAQDAMTSVFGPGNMVARRYTDGRRAVNEAAFNAAGQIVDTPINAVGQQGIDLLNTAKSQAYSSALDPVNLNLNDPKFVGPMSGILGGADAIPAGELPEGYAGKAIRHYVGNNMDPGGAMTGSGFQNAYRGMAKVANKATSKVEGHDVGQAIGQAKDILASTLEEQNPGAYAGFLKANSANRHLNILADAVNAAKNQVDTGEPLFTPAQLGAAATANAKTYSGKIAAASGNRPFNQLAADAQKVMSSKLPESGTAPRWLVTSLATGGLAAPSAAIGYGANGGEGSVVGGLGTLGLLSALGTKKGQQLITAALMKRTVADQVAGRALRRNPTVGGDLFASLGIPLLDSPSR